MRRPTAGRTACPRPLAPASGGRRGSHQRRGGHRDGGVATGALPLGVRNLVAVGGITVGEALVPALDQTRTTGLVTLPGAFVGALFGGASPLTAARFQLVVLVGLLAAESVAAVVLLRLLAAVPSLPPSTATT